MNAMKALAALLAEQQIEPSYGPPVKLNDEAKALIHRRIKERVRLKKRLDRLHSDAQKAHAAFVRDLEAAHPEIAPHHWRVINVDDKPESEWAYEIELPPTEQPKAEQPDWAKELAQEMESDHADVD